MTGTEKQIEYANELKILFAESYQIEMDDNSDDPDYITELLRAVEHVDAYDGDAGKFINWFKRIGDAPNFSAARFAYRKFQMDERIRALK